MATIDWRWLGWQVALLVMGPAIVSATVLLFVWMTGGGFHSTVFAILDISPWALVTYALTMAATASRERRHDARQYKWFYGALIVATIANLLFYAVIVIQRDSPQFSLAGAYEMAIMLSIGSLFLCYRLRTKVAEE